MGASGEDIQLSSAARRALPFSFEAKNQERVNVWSALAQARTNTPDGAQPVVVFKKNQETPHVMISWECFKTLIAPNDTKESCPRDALLQTAAKLNAIALTLPSIEDE